MTSTPQLTPLELGAWERVAAALTLLPAAIDERLKAEVGLNHFDFTLLASLKGAERRARLMSDIAKVTHSSLSRLSHAVTRLESAGYVMRESCDTDRRATWAVLTPAGAQKVAEAQPTYEGLLRELIFDRLDESQAAALLDAFGSILPTRCDDPASN